MQKFLQYDNLCLSILANKPFQTELKKIAGFLKMNASALVADVLKQAYTLFK